MGSFFKFPAFTTLRILLSRFYCFYKTEFKTKKLLKILQKLFVLIGTHIRSRCVRMCKPTLLAPGHQLIRIRPTVAGLLPDWHITVSPGRPSSLTRASMPAFPPPGRRSFGFESCCPGFIVFIKLNLKQKSS